MSWKEPVAEYFTFTKKDSIAILVIVLTIGLVFFLPSFVGKKASQQTKTDTSWIAGLKQLEEKNAQPEKSYSNFNDDDNSQHYQYDRSTGKYPKTKNELFFFDPNTLPPDGWKKLGLRDKTIQTIQNYLSKGGKFRKPEDVQRIYGLFPDEYERIAPYVRIKEENTEGTSTVKQNVPANKPVIPRYSVSDINTADTTALISLPGIGSKLASRITGFRDKLGGFYSIEQIKETYGLPDSTFQRIKPYIHLSSPVKKININTATTEELKAHPYIKWEIAKPVVAYRSQHGKFAQVSDLKKILVITDDVYEKIAPYLSVD